MDITAAALAVLSPMRRAEVVEHVSPSMVSDPNVCGALVTVRAEGRSVAAYWIERGQYRAGNGAPHEAELDAMRERFVRAGWVVELGIFHVRAWAPEHVDDTAGTWRAEWLIDSAGQQLTIAGAAPDPQQGCLFTRRAQ